MIEHLYDTNDPHHGTELMEEVLLAGPRAHRANSDVSIDPLEEFSVDDRAVHNWSDPYHVLHGLPCSIASRPSTPPNPSDALTTKAGSGDDLDDGVNVHSRRTHPHAPDEDFPAPSVHMGQAGQGMLDQAHADESAASDTTFSEVELQRGLQPSPYVPIQPRPESGVMMQSPPPANVAASVSQPKTGGKRHRGEYKKLVESWTQTIETKLGPDRRHVENLSTSVWKTPSRNNRDPIARFQERLITIQFHPDKNEANNHEVTHPVNDEFGVEEVWISMLSYRLITEPYLAPHRQIPLSLPTHQVSMKRIVLKRRIMTTMKRNEMDRAFWLVESLGPFEIKAAWRIVKVSSQLTTSHYFTIQRSHWRGRAPS